MFAQRREVASDPTEVVGPGRRSKVVGDLLAYLSHLQHVCHQRCSVGIVGVVSDGSTGMAIVVEVTRPELQWPTWSVIAGDATWVSHPICRMLAVLIFFK